MSHSPWMLSFGLVALLSAALPRPAAAQENDNADAKQIVIRKAAQAQTADVLPAAEVEAVFAVAEEEGAAVSPYWIGVQLEPLTDILKSHLNLDRGLVAVHVFEDSPAAKGGCKANDIILKAGDKYVKEPGDLLTAVGEAKENEMTITVLRGGKETQLKVKPVKRAEAARAQAKDPQALKQAETEAKEAVQQLEAALHAYKLRAMEGTAPAVDLVRVQPGIVMSQQAVRKKIPDDVSIRITKEGNNPTKIWVKREGKEWEVTEDKIGDLPEEVRGYVQQLHLGPPPAMAVRLTQQAGDPRRTTTRLFAQPVPKVSGLHAAPATPVPPATSAMSKTYQYRVTEAKDPAGSGAESKLDQILKILGQKEDSSVADLREEVKQLRKELEELRKEKK